MSAFFSCFLSPIFWDVCLLIRFVIVLLHITMTHLWQLFLKAVAVSEWLDKCFVSQGWVPLLYGKKKKMMIKSAILEIIIQDLSSHLNKLLNLEKPYFSTLFSRKNCRNALWSKWFVLSKIFQNLPQPKCN